MTIADDGPVIVGISALHHDSAACVLRGSQLVAAAEEERFTRRKHQGGIPTNAFRACLAEAGTGIDEVDAVAVGFDPAALADRRAAYGHVDPDPIDESAIRRTLGAEAPIIFVSHHEAHAASAFHFSPMDNAAVLVVDGVGEWQTTTIGVGRGTALTHLDEVRFPHSLGLFYATITDWLGLRVNHDEYKVMGLAAWSAPSRADDVAKLVRGDDDGRFELDLGYFDFLEGERMFSDAFCQLLGSPRAPGQPFETRHIEVAASAQAVLENRLLALSARARRLTGLDQLCVAGGVMFNAVANGRLTRSGLFERVWFQPVAGDAGAALGAASTLLAATGVRPAPLTDLRLGPRHDPDAVSRLVAATGAGAVSFAGDERGLVDAVAQLIEEGAVVGWFHGRMEFGPRALGARSILADPRRPATRDRINALVKEREAWRPLAPMVGSWACADHFECARELPFMIETVPTRKTANSVRTAPSGPARDGVLVLGAVTHVDGTARPQTVSPATMPRLAELLRAVEQRIGVPVLVNTSFNHADEPIVCNPAESLASATRIGLDALVIDELLLTEMPDVAPSLIATWAQQPVTQTVDNLYPL